VCFHPGSNSDPTKCAFTQVQVNALERCSGSFFEAGVRDLFAIAKFLF